MNDALAQTYAPILKFSKGENFFPMRVDEYLKDCCLYDGKGKRKDPPVTPALMKDKGKSYFLVYADSLGEPVNPEEAAREAWLSLFNLMPGGIGLHGAPGAALEAAGHVPAGGAPGAPELNVLGLDVFGLDEIIDGVHKILVKGGSKVWKPVRKVVGQFFLPEKVLENALRKYGKPEQHDHTLYYRIIPNSEGSGYDVIEYWYFYAFNDGINWHEADWENVTLYFHNDQPHYAVSAQHKRHSDPFKVDGRPTIYVARGSHASYPPSAFKDTAMASNFDLHEKGGRTVSDWKCEKLDDNAPDWIHFQGSWGSMRQEGVRELSAKILHSGGPPLGPKQHRDQWERPCDWANENEKKLPPATLST